MSEKNNDNRQVLIIQNDEEKTPSKWTWAKYGKSIAKYKWWVTGSTLALGLIALLTIQFVYNPSKETFKSEFSYNLAIKSDKSGNGTFLDGSTFNFYDVVSESNLLAVKATNSDFAGIDVARAIKNNDISISVNGYRNSSTNEFVVSTPITYTLSGKLSCFGKQDTTTKFIKAVIDSTKEKAEAATRKYSISALFLDDSVYNSLDFEYQTSLLTKQYDQIKTSMESLYAVTSGDSSAIKGNEDGQSLDSIILGFELSYRQGTGTVFTALQSSLESKKFVNYDATDIQGSINKLTELGESDIESLKATLGDIKIYDERLKGINQSILSGDSAAASQAAKYNEKILELSLAKKDYVKELKTLGYNVPDDVTLDNVNTITLSGDGKIQKLEAVKSGSEEGKNWAKACEAFKNNIINVKNRLVKDVTMGTDVYRYVNNTYRNSVYYSYPGIIDVSGSFSPWIAAGIGLVIGYLASSLICCAVYISKESKDNADVDSTKE